MFALYNDVIWIGIFAWVLFILDGTAVVLGGVILFLEADFDATCSMKARTIGLAVL